MPTTLRSTIRSTSGPDGPSSARGRFALVLLAGVLVAGGASQTIAALRGGADGSRQAEAAVARLDASLNRQAAIRWQASREGAVSPALASALAKTHTELAAVREALARVERASFGLAELTSWAETYERVLEEQVRTIDRDPAQAAALGRTTVEPAFDQFRAARDAAAIRLSDAARTSGLAADLGTLLALVSAAILVSLLFRKWERVRRRLAFETGARTGVELSESRFRSLVQHSSDLVMVVEDDGRVAYVSPSVGRLLGEIEAVGQPLFDLVHPEDAAIVERALEQADRGSHPRPVEWRLRGPSGAWRTFEYVVTLGQDALRGRLVLNGRDVTDRKSLEEALRHQAHHDPLTGLANRALLTDALGRAASRSRRRGTLLGLLMLDLDGFKSVNDTLGHAAGDQLLVGIAERLRRTVRSDSLVARISGDEFAVVLEDVEEPEVADDVGERILAAMRAPFVIDDREVATSFSVGIAVAIAGEPPIDVLLRQADLAMYRAKHRAAGTLERFVPDADDVASVAQRVPRAS